MTGKTKLSDGMTASGLEIKKIYIIRGQSLII